MDFAKFNKDTSLYALARAWMKNKPHEGEEKPLLEFPSSLVSYGQINHVEHISLPCKPRFNELLASRLAPLSLRAVLPEGRIYPTYLLEMLRDGACCVQNSVSFCNLHNKQLPVDYSICCGIEYCRIYSRNLVETQMS